MYRRSLLVLRAATDPSSDAAVAGAPPGWAYVWPRDAGAVALAFAAAGYRTEARRVARFLLRLDLDSAARFRGTGEPVPGRDAQGDAAGWVAVAARATGLAAAANRPRHDDHASGSRRPVGAAPWRDRADYQEKEPGDYLGNAIASAVLPADGPKIGPSGGKSAHRRGSRGSRGSGGFETERGLVRVEGDPESGLDSVAAWAVRPFRNPHLLPAARRTLLRLAADSGRFGLLPSEDWDGGEDPWTAPTAWSAWGLAALAHESTEASRRQAAIPERRGALRLMAALRRAATPQGLLPERVDARTGAPRSATPLAWSHAFAILAVRELWPGEGRRELRAG